MPNDRFYKSKEWEALRLKRLRRDKYVCQECGSKCFGKKRGGISPNVDHIIPRKVMPAKAMDIDNLRTLCQSCHSRLTISDMHGKSKPEIGSDGYPLES